MNASSHDAETETGVFRRRLGAFAWATIARHWKLASGLAISVWSFIVAIASFSFGAGAESAQYQHRLENVEAAVKQLAGNTDRMPTNVAVLEERVANLEERVDEHQRKFDRAEDAADVPLRTYLRRRTKTQP